MTRRALLLMLGGLLLVSSGGCGRAVTRRMEVTAYCGCGKCCGWERGSWKYLKLDQWNRYVSKGPRRGEHYSGRTASGTKPHEARPGLLSADSLVHPWMIPIRIVFFPWLLRSRPGTVAADTDYYPLGTRVEVPGYGHGVVEDRGSGVKGPRRLDVYFDAHDRALRWGRQTLDVRIDR